MSIFGSIVSAIFGHPANTGATAAAGGSAAPTAGAANSPGAASSASPSSSATATPMTPAEVEGMIQKLAAASHEDYNWKQSIVDLMKLLNLDSSLNARKQLAQELGYKGQLNGSAEMNIWLHKQVMTKLAESGGRVPESLKHA
jgi:hypothetical protein